jgi:signal transduction histidine kinase
LVKLRFNFNLQSRITIILLFVAITSMLSYSVFMMIFAHRIEHDMLSTLVGHELEEVVSELAIDSELKMPRTASVNAYLLSRESSDPIPEFLKELSSNVHWDIRVGEKAYVVAIADLADDRIYLTFDTTDLSKQRKSLMFLHIAGGVITTLMIIISGFWLFRRFLLPVSNLAEEVASIDPNERNIRIGKHYRGYEVGLIARSIDQLLDKLDDFVEREQSFTAAVSHEFRTPISVITTATDLLELKGVADTQKGAIDRIKSSTNYMGKVIDSLLFFARNTLNVVEKTLPMISLNEIFLDTLKQYEGAASEKKLALRYKKKSNTKVRISENHLEIMLSNLTRNAIANTDEGKVNVVLFDNGFSVTDTGSGIEADEIDSIVERNYHNSDSSGCGLGLYLVKNICNIYGLKLEIESTIGEGSKFTVIFPEHIVS